MLQHLAPCGLDCVRCAGYGHGEIKRLSGQLVELPGNYPRIAKIREETEPAFARYDHFAYILNRFANASCSSCRRDNVECFLTCPAKTCHRERGVDFCFQCRDYPCDKEFSHGFKERWRKMNDRMAEVGPVEFYHEQVKKPRY